MKKCLETNKRHKFRPHADNINSHRARASKSINNIVQKSDTRNSIECHQVILILQSYWNHYNMLKVKQTNLIKNNSILKEYAFIPIGSTVAFQREESGPWTHGTVTEHHDAEHNGRSYRLWITTTGRIMTRTAGNIKIISILAKQYPWDQMSKQKYIYQDNLYINVITWHKPKQNKHLTMNSCMITRSKKADTP